jgi:hypothetical protein
LIECGGVRFAIELLVNGTPSTQRVCNSPHSTHPLAHCCTATAPRFSAVPLLTVCVLLCAVRVQEHAARFCAGGRYAAPALSDPFDAMVVDVAPRIVENRVLTRSRLFVEGLSRQQIVGWQQRPSGLIVPAHARAHARAYGTATAPALH